MKALIPFDSSVFVRAAIKEVMTTLFVATGLVIVVVFVFLQNWRATLIPLLAVPVAIIGTFALFPLLGFSVNMTSMFGLVLAIGIVVDDAIVNDTHFGRKPRHGDVDPVLRLHRGVIGVRADLERDLNVEQAVVAAVGKEVEHPVEANQLFPQWAAPRFSPDPVSCHPGSSL